MREVVARRELLDLLTSGRSGAEAEASALIRQRLSGYGFGIDVRRVTFQDIHPPLAVLDAYRDVSRAVGDRQRRVNEAAAYRDRVVTEARGQASSVGAGATADARRRTALAASEADAFTTLREARIGAPALTDLRLFWTTIADAMARKDKLILDEEPGRRRHLVVPDSGASMLVPALEPIRRESPASAGDGSQRPP